MTRARLLDAGRRQTWTGTRALALYRCDHCGTPAQPAAAYTQPALFAHGGYGAASKVTDRRCTCGRLRVLDLDTTSPKPYR